ncbi:hypothetical protein SELMODRAFT_404972 [Selaginella moellendorffii]|uniref:Uncharacterized protein n=1 Tax=Selaginella moellendorffii TaxID=88036 RepID=D8QXZ0_SELML|nr:hypothetical protein SELMODRAFT_404972 [Selaginella moellendorffii]
MKGPTRVCLFLWMVCEQALHQRHPQNRGQTLWEKVGEAKLGVLKGNGHRARHGRGDNRFQAGRNKEESEKNSRTVNLTTLTLPYRYQNLDGTLISRASWAPDAQKRGQGVWAAHAGYGANELLLGKIGDFDHRITEQTVFLVNGPKATPRMIQNNAHVIFFMSENYLTKSMAWTHSTCDLYELLLAAPLAGHGDCSVGRITTSLGFGAPVLVHHRKTNYNSRDLKETMAVFASQYVEEQLSWLEEEDTTLAIEYIRQNQGISDETVLMGKRFEHQLFRSDDVPNRVSKHDACTSQFQPKHTLRDGNFKGVYDMEEGLVIEDEQEKMEDDAKGEVEVAEEVQIIFPLGFVLELFSRSRHACLAAKKAVWNLRIQFNYQGRFQILKKVTVNDRHHAQAKYIDEVIKRYNLKRFYFVVSQEMFNWYPYQL